MAQIKRFPIIHHLRSEPIMHTLRYRRGRLVAEGRGLAFWFRPLPTAVAEIPLDDRELPYLFHGRSADFQDVTVQGTITYRVADPARAAERIDFTIDLDTGRWTRTPLEQIGGLLTQLAQQVVGDYLTHTRLETIVIDGVDDVRLRITDGLRAEVAVEGLGLELIAVRVAAIAPEAEVEKALQTPTREQIQQAADEATFQRRALAVEKERAIGENELQNRIELARREEGLVVQEGANAQRRASEGAAARRIEVEAAAGNARIQATVEAERIEQVGGAEVEAERKRLDAYRDLAPAIVLGLALREAAGKLERIDHLNITPDLLGPALAALADAGGRRLGGGEGT